MAPEKTLVQLGRVLAGAQPFCVGNISDTYRGLILTQAGERPAIIKDLPAKELANEVLAAAIGLRLNLPIPPAFLAFAPDDAFSGRKGPKIPGGTLVFASVDVGHPQVAMLCLHHGIEAILRRIAEWPQVGRLYGFDTLIANIDRHAGNVLFSGDKEIWLIDHGHCFSGPHWTKNDLMQADKSFSCRLNEWLTPILTDKERTKAIQDAYGVEIDANDTNLSSLLIENHIPTILDQDDLDCVTNFVSARRAHIPKIASSALGEETLT